MKRLGSYAICLALASAVVPSMAPAAPVIDFNGTSGTFGNAGIGSGMFDDSYTFTVPNTGNVGGTISSIALSVISDINFTSVSINGVEFTNHLSGTTEFRSLASLPVTAGDQMLRVRGQSGGNGSYSGTLAFAAAQVPEPGSFATVLFALGLLVVGRRASSVIQARAKAA